jgi:hypothetical protein
MAAASGGIRPRDRHRIDSRLNELQPGPWGVREEHLAGKNAVAATVADLSRLIVWADKILSE